MEKIDSELGYWKDRFQKEGNQLQNSWYQRLMLAISGKDKAWFKDKTVCDFGCGPRGSLEWLDQTNKKICADVLVEQYMELGISKHEAIYISTTEKNIPLPSEFCDVVFTINSIDHVNNIQVMCAEILRITKVGGYVMGSINLNELPTPAEPQTITEDLFHELIGSKLTLDHIHIAPKHTGEGGVYKHLFAHCEDAKPLPKLGDEVGCLWFAGQRKYP